MPTSKPPFTPRPPEDPAVIEARWRKKKARIEHLSTEMRRLRLNVSTWLKSDDEKEFLTALVIAMMDKTFERIGNDSSADNGHYGVTGWQKNHVTINGNKITLKYTGKSGVEHEKSFSDEKLAKALKRAIKNSPSKYIFETSDGFRIRADRVNRVLREFGINCKDLRGFGANRITVEALNKIEPEDTDKKRKRQLNKILKSTAGKVGHGRPTLKKHYLVPELWDEWVNEGKIIDLKDMGYLERGGAIISVAKEENICDTPFKVNNDGGCDYVKEKDRKIANSSGLITLPENVSGTNCSSCFFQKNGFCGHKKVLLPVTKRMCCAYWNSRSLKYILENLSNVNIFTSKKSSAAKINSLGGYDYSGVELERAKNADLIALPKNISGTNCSVGNCKFSKKGDGCISCIHPKIKLPVTEKMSCSFWDNNSVDRSWGKPAEVSFSSGTKSFIDFYGEDDGFLIF